jgi:hypothetical protein
MHLLKKGIPFCWDEAAQGSFEALKCALTPAPLFGPLGYNKLFLFYLAIVESTIDMVLVQEDVMLEEHVIYYLFCVGFVTWVRKTTTLSCLDEPAKQDRSL